MRPAVLIYDGECPVCVKAVEWVRSRSDPHAFEFLSCHSKDLLRRFPSIEKAACLQAMHLVLPGGTVLAGAQAVPEILSRLRRYRWSAFLFRLPGAGILSRLFYRWFAKRRHRAAGFFSPARKDRDREIH
jgi:predicted DCC family thiol-disulfide oxidoreductase YuxK